MKVNIIFIVIVYFLGITGLLSHPIVEGDYHVHPDPGSLPPGINPNFFGQERHDFEWSVIDKIEIHPNGGELKIFDLILGKDIKNVVIGRSSTKNSLKVNGSIEAKDGLKLADGILIRSKSELKGEKGDKGDRGQRGSAGDRGNQGPAGRDGAGTPVAICSGNTGFGSCSCNNVTVLREVISGPDGFCAAVISENVGCQKQFNGCCAVCR